MHLNFYSWNINGIRASIKKDLFSKVKILNPDFLCLQEIKCQDDTMSSIFPNQLNDLNDFTRIQNDLSEDITSTDINSNNQTHSLANSYFAFWHSCSFKKGYSGTAILIKKEILDKIKIIKQIKEIGVEKYDIEGRITGIDFHLNNKKYLLLNGYFPQGGREGRVLYKIGFYDEIYKLINNYINSGYDIILTGDLNTTISDTDLARPKENRKTTGCLPEERVALSWLISEKEFNDEQLLISNTEFHNYQNLHNSLNLVDTFRFINGKVENRYTYWDQISKARERNVGWRIDYFIVSQSLTSKMIKAEIIDNIFGSDHCPVMINIDL
jgi:exodeoxyribonuclease III